MQDLHNAESVFKIYDIDEFFLVNQPNTGIMFGTELLRATTLRI